MTQLEAAPEELVLRPPAARRPNRLVVWLAVAAFAVALALAAYGASIG